MLQHENSYKAIVAYMCSSNPKTRMKEALIKKDYYNRLTMFVDLLISVSLVDPALPDRDCHRSLGCFWFKGLENS